MKIIQGGDEKINRKAVENRNNDILLSPENNRLKDHLHYRKSGLNQVLCKLAKKNNVAIGFDFCLILKSNSLDRAKFLGRMIQNVKLCRKYKVKMIIGCFSKEKRNEITLKAFSNILGIRGQEMEIYRNI